MFCPFPEPKTWQEEEANSGIWICEAFAPQKAKDYVCKADKTFVEGPFEAGRQVGQGQREDLYAVAAAIDAGATYTSLRKARSNLMVLAKHKRFVQELESDTRPARTELQYPITWKDLTMLKPDPANKKRNWWIRAPPDFGKTREFNALFKGKRAYWIRGNLAERWEDYDHEEVIIYDDATLDFAELTVVTAAVDGLVHVPGKTRYERMHFKEAQVRTIIVLTNKRISDCGFSEIHVPAVEARFTVRDYYPVGPLQPWSPHGPLFNLP